MRREKKGSAYSKRELSQLFLQGLGAAVVDQDGVDLDSCPLELKLREGPVREIRVYLYNAKRSKVGTNRPGGELKINLKLRGQALEARGNFDHSGDCFVLLAGYLSDYDTWVFWDAGLYRDFAFNRNLQCKLAPVLAAFSGEIGEQVRQLRNPTTAETVVCVSSSRLLAGIARRLELSLARLLRSS